MNLIYQFFVHTERVGRLPRPIEFVFNTPSHHRVHHASDAEYLDKNYGGILIIWDRLLGTFAAEQHRPTYGLTKNVDSYNPFKLEYHEYGSIWRDLRASGVAAPAARVPVRPARMAAHVRVVIRRRSRRPQWILMRTESWDRTSASRSQRPRWARRT